MNLPINKYKFDNVIISRKLSLLNITPVKVFENNKNKITKFNCILFVLSNLYLYHIVKTH